MAWSTRQLAELAGTTVKAVRYYHEKGVLDEPERGPNGYKRYGVTHLVELLRIKRLLDLGLPLSQIAGVSGTGAGSVAEPEEALRALDEELVATIERLQRVRAELSVILRGRAPADLPEGFGAVRPDLTEADRALVLVYSRVFDDSTMGGLRDMLRDGERSPEDAEFETLPANADDSTRQDLAERYAPQIDRLRQEHPWFLAPTVQASRGADLGDGIVSDAIAELYNEAQVDVLARVHRILKTEALS